MRFRRHPNTASSLGAILTFALIAWCESPFSAAGIDQMHDGPKTHYNKELMAQGWGTRSAACWAVQRRRHGGTVEVFLSEPAG